MVFLRISGAAGERGGGEGELLGCKGSEYEIDARVVVYEWWDRDFGGGLTDRGVWGGERRGGVVGLVELGFCEVVRWGWGEVIFCSSVEAKMWMGFLID